MGYWSWHQKSWLHIVMASTQISFTSMWLLGLVCYLAASLPSLADHTGILTKPMMKESEKGFLLWMPKYQVVFDAIKVIVTSWECLTTIDLLKIPKHKIYVTTNASDKCLGAILSFGESWESAQPIIFNSMRFKGTELNYPVQEKELLAIICALKIGV